MNSGWGAKAGDNAAFKNVGADGKYHFPGFGADAVQLLIERDAGAIGVDTMSLDPGARPRSTRTSAGSDPTTTGSRTSPTWTPSRRAARR